MIPYTNICAMLEEAILKAPSPDYASLIGELERLKAMAWGRMMAGNGLPGQATPCEEDLLTIPQVATRLKMSPYRAYELARQGKLRVVKIGKLVRVTPAAIQEFVTRMNGGRPA